MQKKYLEVGKIVNTHGLMGEMKMQLWCDGIDFIKGVKVLYLDTDGESSVELVSVRPQKGGALIKISGVNAIEKADTMKNLVLYVNRDDVEIEEGRHFIQDLIGCNVVDVNSGAEYGILEDVTNTGANDIYNVKKNDGQLLLIPVIDEIVREIDEKNGIIKIKVMKGLFLNED